jgi:nicotinate phosphoribosyltransferase
MIINSLLDNDMYKFYMQQFVFHQFPKVDVEYEFKCRSGEDLSPYADKIQEEINHLCSLKFTEDEILYLNKQEIFKYDFLTYLINFQLNKDYVIITKNPFTLKIKGNWLETILFEVPILAIISETYFKKENYDIGKELDKVINKAKIAIDNGFSFSDFGTRRRFSYSLHDIILDKFSMLYQAYLTVDFFNGTSNVYFAKKYGIKPIGTMAHELFMAMQQLCLSLKYFQEETLLLWILEYEGKLGIALSDTINIDSFLNDFDAHYSNVYQGVRQDSGDPFVIGEKVIKHYENLGVDPKTKTIIFSDNLNFDKAAKLYNHFKDRINVSFGIGTNLTNDIEGVKPLSMVIKMQRCNGKPVAKISDEPAKAQCQDEEYLRKLKETFGVK